MPVLQRISLTLILVAILGGCSSLPEGIDHPAEPYTSYGPSTLSVLADEYQSEALEQATTAVRLQESGWDALAQRLALVESAEHTIDIQYYIWNSDESGRYLASRLLAAADRGVKIRVMLDDINLNEREGLLSALDAHPNVEIRIFNPTPTRRGFSKWLSFVGDFSRLNRRMHNKSFTVDGTLSVVGGRNIGDEYFDLSDEINFRDRDVLVMGTVVTTIQTSFIEYWDSRWSYPVDMLGDDEQPDLSTIDDITVPQYKNYPELPLNREAADSLLKEALDEMPRLIDEYVNTGKLVQPKFHSSYDALNHEYSVEDSNEIRLVLIKKVNLGRLITLLRNGYEQLEFGKHLFPRQFHSERTCLLIKTWEDGIAVNPPLVKPICNEYLTIGDGKHRVHLASYFNEKEIPILTPLKDWHLTEEILGVNPQTP